MNPRKALVTSCFLGLLVSAVLYQYSPARVAVHFNSAGLPNSWASREANLTMWIVVFVFVTLFFLALSWLIKKTPQKNMKKYRLFPKIPGGINTVASNMMYSVGAALNLFFIALGIETFRANMTKGGRLDGRLLSVLLIVFCAYAVGWQIRFFIGVKPGKPAESEGGEPDSF